MFFRQKRHQIDMYHTDRVPITELKRHYGNRKFYSEYVPALGIKIQREGRFGFVTPEEAKLLEQYHEARGKGEVAKLAFLDKLGRVLAPVPQPNTITTSTTQQLTTSVPKLVPERLGLLGTAAPAPLDLLEVAKSLEDMPKLARFLATHMMLQEAAWSNLVVPKEILLILLERKQLPSCKDNKFSRYGFEFIACTPKRTEWRVQFHLAQY